MSIAAPRRGTEDSKPVRLRSAPRHAAMVAPAEPSALHVAIPGSTPATKPAAWSFEEIRDGVHCVREGDHVVGFVEEVGIVYVALSGSVLASALEVNQSLEFDTALRAVHRSARGH